MRLFIFLILSSLGFTSYSGAQTKAPTKAVLKPLTQAEGRRFLAQSDVFTAGMSNFDLSLATQNLGATEKDFLHKSAEQVLEWTDSELLLLRRLHNDFAAVTQNFSLPYPEQISIIKTTGVEQYGAAYTRGAAIVFPQHVLSYPYHLLFGLYAHEIFHVLTRGNTTFQNEMVGIIGYQPTKKPIVYKSKVLSVLRNPDYPNVIHAIKVESPQGSFRITPILVTPASAEELLQSNTSVFSTIRIKFVVLNDDDSLLLNEQGEALAIDTSLTNHDAQIGHNTHYIISPEEAMAENFSLMIVGLRNSNDLPEIKSPWVLDKILGSSSLKNQKTSHFTDLVRSKSAQGDLP